VKNLITVGSGSRDPRDRLDGHIHGGKVFGEIVRIARVPVPEHKKKLRAWLRRSPEFAVLPGLPVDNHLSVRGDRIKNGSVVGGKLVNESRWVVVSRVQLRSAIDIRYRTSPR
jgi:hypothetical protein